MKIQCKRSDNEVVTDECLLISQEKIQLFAELMTSHFTAILHQSLIDNNNKQVFFLYRFSSSRKCQCCRDACRVSKHCSNGPQAHLVQSVRAELPPSQALYFLN